METAITTSPAVPVPAKRRRWWLRAVLMALGLVVIVPAGLIGYSALSTRLAREKAEAEADATDPSWRMRDLLLARREVPDKENSALHVIALAGKVKAIHIPISMKYAETFAKPPPPTVQLSGPQLDLLRNNMGEFAELRAEARQLKDYSYGRFPIQIDPTFIATIATTMPNQQKARAIAEWFEYDAFLLAHEKRHNEALDSCRACLCAARSMGDEPLINAHLTRLGLQAQTVVLMERVLAQGQADEAPLQEMQALLELEIKESNWLVALRGERAGTAMLFDNFSSGKVPFSKIVAPAPPGKSSRFSDWMADNYPSTLMRHYPEHLQDMTRVVEIAKLPLHEQLPKLEAWGAARMTSSNPLLSRMWTPGLKKVHRAECRSQAHLRAAAAALACERYRLAKGNWPDSLDDLVRAQLLAAVPLDPINGAPLRYRKVNGMIVVYSIGADETDDGGHIDRAAPNPGVDIGFRLWDPDRRGLPPGK